MSRREKLLEKIKNNPKDVRFEDLCKILENQGYIIINKRGSYYSFSNGEKVLTIVKPHSGKKFVMYRTLKRL